MDVEMFLEGHAGWEVDSPHHPIILHEMFQHAIEQGAERGGMYDPLGPLTEPPKVGPKGRHLCHPAGRTSDQ